VTHELSQRNLRLRDCGNYGQPYNPRAIHNQSCECGNYPVASSVKANAAPATSATKRIDVPIELEDEVRAFIAAKAQEKGVIISTRGGGCSGFTH
jgi:hypothetical protein